MVFAVGINAMQKLVVANPVLAARNEFQRVMNLQVGQRARHAAWLPGTLLPLHPLAPSCTLVRCAAPAAPCHSFACPLLPQSLDVIATRLFFDRIVPTRFPANVLSGFEPSAGATFFNLNDLQVGRCVCTCRIA